MVIIVAALIFYACGKGGSYGGGDPCNGVVIAVNTTVTNTNAGASAGSITATASGGSAPYTYSINGGAYQSSGSFNNLAKGNYTVASKDSKGCTGSVTATVGENNSCAAPIMVSAATTSSDPCAASGTITVTSSGGVGALSYSLDNGAFGASTTFSNVSAGSHTITVKDAGSCSSSASATIAALAAGAKFSAVRGIIQASCAVAGCHVGGASAAGGVDFSVDCNIVARAAAIKARAVDQANTPTQMPKPPRAALSASDRDNITAWVAAGGKYTN